MGFVMVMVVILVIGAQTIHDRCGGDYTADGDWLVFEIEKQFGFDTVVQDSYEDDCCGSAMWCSLVFCGGACCGRCSTCGKNVL